MIEIVSATRHSKTKFWKSSPLGQSLLRFKDDPRITSFIAFENLAGLPEIYNARIDSQDSAKVLVFMHDDVWIDDIFFVDRILEGLARFNIIGVAGNRRRVANQSIWAACDDEDTWDSIHNLSGSIASGASPFGKISWFGNSPAPCELLDGVFLASPKETLRTTHVRFDSMFRFNFYDLDFCRSARSQGLTLGTWPICLTHQSDGKFYGNPQWVEARLRYLEKWEN